MPVRVCGEGAACCVSVILLATGVESHLCDQDCQLYKEGGEVSVGLSALVLVDENQRKDEKVS